MATIDHNPAWTDEELLDHLKAAYVGDTYLGQSGTTWQKTGEAQGVGIWKQVL